ncbi:acetyl/propionyl/methylcrotonyl-CoA carboxylase subunit alpha [Steroidobacter sp. S1-65]|uniref:Acetyl/propionyl/methylcrotonyl-CoA carboxylase subunit alpha n=1 Tax=Steroidobacter gossypii TaxID=2805490 RepID=A0ABS1WUL1_9GAMM|nr:acetyl/propionyl/methylcrotonyl-CoA carboxylase subunit alpha [Steroidobacter gossypii]MBM0104653.1 acetyl/propionyl/methylcrotonyl-CoA carboxylase subunit alpha [Steroidobacter gossypii]
MFTKILIANRGEIACRVIATCRKLGIRTVAVYSEADAGARHVRLADEAYCVGPAASRESYLRVDRIIEVCKQSGAQAVHPGYGFLSENEHFALACEQNGIVFIGPPVKSIRAMGLKSAAKAIMQQAGVPLVPGYHGADQDPALLQREADRIGYPVLIKASAGGGGKGMRVVNGPDEFAAALASCQREARTSFGDDHVLIEKYLLQPRHIEIQVFADKAGHTISLHERDCSSQRRHQKVVEEAPAPGVDADQRVAMGKAACDAARAVGYVGAGTVEFIADSAGNFYFMEMNTRLQVEHPVTEMITGLDLVEWQLRIAAGEDLPLTQEQVPLNGHAIEVRIYAEEPEKGFLPSVGRLVCFQAPAPSAHVRLDTGVEQGDEITPHYDPMIAKLIVWERSREAAIERMLGALAETRIVGVGHNVNFLSRLVGHAAFREGRVDTGLIERERATLMPNATELPAGVFEVAALAQLSFEREQSRSSSPWSLTDGWRINGAQTRSLQFVAGEQTANVSIRYSGDGYVVGDQPAKVQRLSESDLRISIGQRHINAAVVKAGEQLHVFFRGRQYVLTYVDPLLHAGETEEVHGGLSAPMPGKIIALLAEPGAEVAKGAPLLVMEAMKMELTVFAPGKGKIVSYLCNAGDQVKEGVPLVDFQAGA